MKKELLIKSVILSVVFIFLYGCAEHQVNKGDFHYAEGKSWKDDDLKINLLNSKLENDSGFDEFYSTNTADHYYKKLTAEPAEGIFTDRKKILEANVPKVSLSYLGLRYRRGSDPDMTSYSDCSHLVSAITRKSLANSGYSFAPHYAPSQTMYASHSFKIEKEDVKPGDLIFFKKAYYTKQRKGKGKKSVKVKTGERIYHVGIITKVKSDTIYFTHASSDYGVIETSTNSRDWHSYWAKHFHSYSRWRPDVFAKTDSIAKSKINSNDVN
ncbi:MAG: C40 family peptidase [Nitrospirae bacterium YQR-1]